MSPEPSGDATPLSGTDLAGLGLFLGLAGGLIEGVGHMILQRFVLENSWFPIIWIASVSNGLLLFVVASALAAGWWFFAPPRWALRSAVFVLAAAATLPVTALILKEWIHPLAIVTLTLGISAAMMRWIMSWASPRRTLARGLLTAGVGCALAFVVVQGGAWGLERFRTTRLPAGDPDAPDIMLVVIDALRADHLGAYGYARATSPTLNRLADDGLLFENAYSTSSYTLPSHASLLTGRYPHEHGVEWQTSKSRAGREVPNLPETLTELGYRTGGFSANTFWFTREHGFGRGFLHFEDFFHSPADMFLRTAWGSIVTRFVFPAAGWEDIPARKRAADIRSAVVDWWDRDRSTPAFVMINFMDAHDPYLPPEPHRSQFAPGTSPGGLINWRLHTPTALAPAELQSEIDAYDGAIRYVDAELAALLAELGSGPSDRDLLVIVTSDHGEEFAEHGGFLHGNHLYREVIQVPLVLWGPGAISAPRRVSTPVTNASIPATIMDLLGADDSIFPAPSLLTLSTESGSADWPSPLSELAHRPWAKEGTAVRSGSVRSLVTPEWHFIEHDVGPPELFDLASDPLEQQSRADAPELQSVIRRLSAVLRGAIGR